jgi:hypothetical protein
MAQRLIEDIMKIRIWSFGIAPLALMASSAAFADGRVNVDINPFGWGAAPPVVYESPRYYAPPPVVYYGRGNWGEHRGYYRGRDNYRGRYGHHEGYEHRDRDEGRR